MLLSGCGSKVPEETSNAEKDSIKEKIIRVSDTGDPKIDPGGAYDTASIHAIINLYDSLVFPNHEGTISPWLATDWEVSNDGLTWVFNIRRGVKFHNGDELTAEDVAFSMQRLLTMGEGFAYLFNDVVKEAEAIDTYKVQFKLKKSFGPFLSTLVRLYVLNKDQVLENKKSGQYGEFGDYGKEWLVSNDAGSGPYMLKEKKAQEYVYGVKFPDYWGGWDKDAPDAFKIIGTTEAATIRTLMSRRELEVTDSWQTEEALRTLSQIPGVELLRYVGPIIQNIMLNTKKPPTDDVNFRKALSYAFDYETATKLFPGSTQARGPVPEGIVGHNPDVFQYKRDLEKAKEYLSKSKYANNIKNYTVEVLVCSEVPDYEKVALLLQANAAEIGVNVKITKVPWLSLVDMVSKQDTTPNAIVVQHMPNYNEAGATLEVRYHSKSTGTWEQGEWLQDPEIDAAIDDALRTMNKEERLAKYRKIQEKIVDLAPTIFVVNRADSSAYQAAYIYYPSAELQKAGKPICPVMGYTHYFRDFRVYPDRIPK
ncbi:ABC transporter substrate-binding protein [Thermoanaerobacteraceae bacterium SP2]|nr:ABC transporter substrate-binding protein [Thermoanaerobacteraceae bacterium SP2]